MSNELPPLPPGGFGALPPPPPPPDGGGFSSMPPPGSFDGSSGGGGLPHLEPGIPWEDSTAGIFARWWKTMCMVLAEPGRFFQQMPTMGGLKSPLIYAIFSGYLSWPLAVLCGAPGLALQFAMLYNSPNATQSYWGVSVPVWTLLMYGAQLLLMPLSVVLFVFLWGGLYHLSLMLVGGARAGFEPSVRVVSYVNGSTYVPFAVLGGLSGVPLLNCLMLPILLAGGIYALVLVAMGLIKVHQCEVWQGAVAVIIPMVLCCVVGIGAYFAIIAAVIAAM